MTPKKSRVHFSPKHSWNDRDRLVLVLLELCYSNHARDYTAIFNYIHRSKLLVEGFKAGMPVNSITAQLYEFQHGGTGSKFYESVNTFSLSQLKNIFSQQLSVIEHAARHLKIKLVDKTTAEQPRARPSILKNCMMRVSVTPSETTVTTWVPNDDDEDGSEYYTPTRRHPRSQRVRLDVPQNKNFLSPMASPNSFALDNRRRPFFVYRAFEIEHGLRARRYLEAGVWIPQPPRFRSSAFRREVRSHLHSDPRYDSPFLSFAQNPAVAIKHAYNKMSTGVEMGFAIFSYDDLTEDAVSRFGPHSGPYLVPNICKHHELYDLPGSYTGTGEFLVWGSVTAEPVTVISGMDTLMIRAIMRTIRVLNFESGARLNKYLPKDITEQYTELFLYQLVTGYKVAGHKYARKNTKYLEFIRGAQAASDGAHNEEYDMVEDDDMVEVNTESDPDSDFGIVEVRPAHPRRNGFPASAWRSDTAEEIYDIDFF